jgi:hypothetical protein
MLGRFSCVNSSSWHRLIVPAGRIPHRVGVHQASLVIAWPSLLPQVRRRLVPCSPMPKSSRAGIADSNHGPSVSAAAQRLPIRIGHRWRILQLRNGADHPVIAWETPHGRPVPMSRHQPLVATAIRLDCPGLVPYGGPHERTADRATARTRRDPRRHVRGCCRPDGRLPALPGHREARLRRRDRGSRDRGL